MKCASSPLVFYILTLIPIAAAFRRFKDPSELDSDHFCNNYSIFKCFSKEFQDFILTILHSEPAKRVPPSQLSTDAPVVRLFRKFPRLCGSAGLTAEIIENLTRSPTQTILLQVRGDAACIFEMC